MIAPLTSGLLPQGLVAVTGANGFIGRRVVAQLHAAGVAVRTISRGAPHDTRGSHITLGDAPDDDALRQALEGVRVVIHLAGRAHQLRESGSPQAVAAAFAAANEHLTAALCSAARRTGVHRVVFVSSIGVNAAQSRRPVRAGDLPAPVDPYAHSKLAAERAVAAELASGATDYVIVRPPLVYGSDAPGNFGQLLRLVARLPLIPLGAVHEPRTLIAADSLAGALLTAASAPGCARRTFLVGDARDTDVAEIVRSLVRGMGRPRWVVVPLASPLLAAAARVAGKGRQWEKLAAPLVVDTSAFTEATGWVAPTDPAIALEACGREYVARNR